MSEALYPAVTIFRGHLVENTHLAHIAVVDAQGDLLHRLGDPARLTLARSAAKPAQALAIVQSGALERFGLDEADLALMCGSHNAEAQHVARTRAMLARLGLDESALRCGPHPSLSDAVQRRWLREGFEPGPACSNCSGKHAGMLAAALALGCDPGDYHLPDHPVQVHTRRTVAAACGLPDSAVQWAVDGCNLPTPAFPLDRLAFLFARLASAADHAPHGVPEGGANACAPEPELARIYQAMTRHPELVAGEGRFCTRLMAAFDGALVGGGADASYAIGVRASAATQALGARGAIGIAVKVEDGSTVVLQALVCELLSRLALADTAQLAALASFHRPRMRNTAGVEIGHLDFPFILQSA